VPHEIPDKLTALTIPGLWNALLVQWETLGVNPTRCAVELKLAHIKLETGLKYCHNWCIGNKRVGRGGTECWQHFSCGEEIPESQLASVVALGPELVDVKSRYMRNGVPFVSVWVRVPKSPTQQRHQWTRFAAYETLTDGIVGQLAYLKRRPAVLAALMTGDAKAYNDALVAADYYTAGKERYLKSLQANLADVVIACRDLDWGDVA